MTKEPRWIQLIREAGGCRSGLEYAARFASFREFWRECDDEGLLWWILDSDEFGNPDAFDRWVENVHIQTCVGPCPECVRITRRDWDPPNLDEW